MTLLYNKAKYEESLHSVWWTNNYSICHYLHK